MAKLVSFSELGLHKSQKGRYFNGKFGMAGAKPVKLKLSAMDLRDASSQINPVTRAELKAVRTKHTPTIYSAISPPKSHIWDHISLSEQV
jgi:hypothetical protein